MDFELSKKDLNVKIYGKDYVLRKPSISQVEILIENIGKDSSGSNIKAMKSFIVQCGLPADVCDSMDADDFNSLAIFIMDYTKKKLVAGGTN